LCAFRVFSVAVMEKCCDARGDVEYHFLSGYLASQNANTLVSAAGVDRKSMGHTVAERSWKDPTLCIFRVFSVAVMGKCCDACGDGDNHFLSCCLASRMAVIDLLRLPLTGSRWDRRWLSGRGKTPTLCVFPIFRVAVMEKRCNACGDGDNHFLSSCLASRVPVIDLLRLPLTGSRWGLRWLSGRGKTPTLCVLPVNTVAVMGKCCDACGEGEYYFRSSSLTTDGADVSGASIVFDRKSMGQTVAERSWKVAEVVCISCMCLAWRLRKSFLTLAVTGNTIYR
jgi:hypothetical protein